MDLTLGDVPEGASLEGMRAAWSLQRDEILGAYFGPRMLAAYAGRRPWAWWEFEAGEAMPDGMDAETMRLAQLGELRPEEVVVLREHAVEAGLRIGTDSERRGPAAFPFWPDRDALALWHAVEAVLAPGDAVACSPIHNSRRGTRTRRQPPPPEQRPRPCSEGYASLSSARRSSRSGI